MTNASARKTENILAVALVALLAAVLLTSHAVGGVLARYTTAGASGDEARVAVFGHSESVTFTDWSATIKPGSTQTLALTVSNARSATVSEVAQTYDIELVTSGNLPLTYTVTRASDGATIGTFTEGSGATNQTFSVTDGSMSFQAGTKRTDAYTVTASWPAGSNASKLANIPDFLQVNINVRQID